MKKVIQSIALLLIVAFSATPYARAQAPNITYANNTQTYTAGTAITALKPTNTGGAVPDGLYGTPTRFAGDIIATTNEDGTEIHFGLRYPTGLALDAAGNIYVANYDNNVVSKITPDGVISTFAGSGASGNANGTGTAATFKRPTGVAVDAAGNVYVTDGNNNRIRKITPAGVVSNFAGSGTQGSANGTATAASFYAPAGITIDAGGNLYVTDNNNLIRKITPAGQVSTLAGSGSAGSANGQGSAASFNGPGGIAIDAAGNLYVTDSGNNLVRKITPAGMVTTLAGSGVAGNSDGSGAAASFDHPAGIAVGSDGNLYVADAWNRRVRKITPEGIVSTFVGSGFYDNIYGLATDATGNIYVTEGTGLNSHIRKIASTGYAISPALPAGLDLDGQGRIIGTPTAASPATTYTITAYNAAGRSTATIRIAVSAPVLEAPNISYNTPRTYTAGTAITDLSPSNTGGAVPDALYGLVSTLAGSGEQGSANGTGTAASFSNPAGVATDAAGNVYVADGNHRIRKISPSGVVSTLVGVDANGDTDYTVPNSYGLAVDALGNVFAPDHDNNRIFKITPAGQVTVFAGSGVEGTADGLGTAASFYGPYGVATDAAGNVYVADFISGLIRKISPTGNVTTLAGSGGEFNSPTGLVVDAGGNVYVADNGNNRIRKITPAGVVTTFVQGQNDGNGTGAGLYYPISITIDAAGNIYVVDDWVGNPRIRKITPAGAVSTFAGGNSVGKVNGYVSSFNGPSGLAADAAGNLYVADKSNNLIRKIPINGYAISPTLLNGLIINGSGAISGTPRAASPATTYTITAYNAAGSSSATLELTINATGPVALPAISYAGPQTYGTGAAITPLAPANTGGAVPPNFYKQVSTLAGSGTGGTTDGTSTAAKFYYPSGTALDAAGNIYVADTENHLIRKITPAGVTTTFAGKGGEFSRPTGLAVGADGSVYVTDMGSHTIRKVSPGGVVSTLAGSGEAGYGDGAGTAAKFNEPRGITIDATGNLLVADGGNCRIRKITPAGQVSTLAGSGDYSYQDGNGTGASFFYPIALTVGAGGNIYVADTYNYRIRRVTPAGQVSTLAGSGVAGKADGTGAAASFNLPGGITADAAGNLYVADTDNNLIRMVTLAGKVTTMAGSGTAGKVNGIGTTASFSHPAGLAAGADGNLYIADTPNNLIRKVAYTGYTISPALPAGLTFGTNGNITGTPTAISPATTYTITAYNAGGSGTATVSVAVVNDLEFAAIPLVTYGIADFSPGATASSGTISYVSSDLMVATIIAGKIRVVGVGTSTITATCNGISLSQNLTVTRASLYIKANNMSKTYGSANPLLTVSYSGFRNGETSTALATQPEITTTATTTSPVGAYIITAGGALAANYTIYYDITGTLSVTPAALTVTAANKSKTYGSANPALTATYSGFVNGETAASLTTQPTIATTAATTSPIGTYPVTASGAASPNYTISYAAGSLTVAPATLIITAANKSKSYGSANPALTVSYSGFKNSETNAVLTTQPTIATTATTTSPVGTYPVTASGAASPNYAISYSAGTLTVTPARLTITAANKSKSYGSANPALTVSYSGFKNSETSAVLTTQPTIATTAITTSPVGTYPITVNGAASPNYAISYVAGTLTVTGTPVSFSPIASQGYGTMDFEPGATGGIITYASSNTAVATILGGKVHIAGAGTTSITASNGTSTAVQTLTVNKAALVITADNKIKPYGSANPALTATYSGFVNGETSASLTTQPTIATTATITSLVGAYPVTASGAAAANYTITYIAGTLTVDQVSLVIAADNKLKDYGTVNPILTATYSGFVNGETAASLTTQPTIATTATTTSPVGTYPIMASGAASPNYTISYVAGTLTVTGVPVTFSPIPSQGYGTVDFIPGAAGGSNITFTSSNTAVATIVVGKVHIVGAGTTSITANNCTSTAVQTLTVNKAALVIKADNKLKSYGSANPVLTATYSGFVNGETAANLTTQPILATTAAITSPGGSYPVTASGAASANYTITYTAGTVTVNPALVTIAATNKSKTYGTANPALTVTYSGFRNSETSAVLTTKPAIITTATSASGVGTYAITAGGAVASNYIFAYVAGTLTVTPADLLAEVNDASRAYGSANPAFALAYTGFVNGDGAAAAFTDFPKATTTATATSPAGGYAITLSGGVAPNYSISYGDGLLSVEKAPLKITAENKTKAYGSANPALAVTYSGFKNGESATVLSTNPNISTTATAISGIGTYPITVKAASANNYDITYAAGTLTVTPATLTITAANKSKTYGAANPGLTVTYSGLKNSETSAVLTTKPAIATTATTTSGVGTYPITVGGAVAPNYNIAYSAGSLTISPAELLIQASDASRSYGKVNPAFAFTYTGFVNGDGAATAITILPKATTTATLTSPAGNSYVITVSGGVAPNYNIKYGDGLLTVGKVSLKITAVNQTRAYGSANPALTFTYTGFKNGESATVISTKPTISTTATVTSPIGTYPVTVKGASSANYSISYVAGTLTVNKAVLTITAESKLKTYGSENPVLTATYSGFANGEDESELTAQPTLVTTATTASAVGTYPIAASGATAANYSISYAEGALTVNPAELIVEAGDASRSYGSANPAFALAYTGLVNGEAPATAFTTPPNASTSAVTASLVGGYAIVVNGGVAPNYSISYSEGLLTVTKAPLKITADGKSKVYGSANPMLTLTYSGFKNGEGATVLSTRPTIGTTATALSAVGTYPITVKGASGNNYIISYVPGTLTVMPGVALPVLEPAISYALQIFTKGVASTPLKPANAGGAVPATAYGQVSTFAGSSLSGSADGAATIAKFKNPSGAAFDRAGNLFIVDISGHVIRKISPDGTVVTFAGNGTAGAVNATGTAARFSYPCGVAIDANDNLYVTDRNNQLIRKVTPAGVVSTYAGTGSAGAANGNRTAATFGFPTGIAIDAAGNLYVADSSNGLIRKITPAGVVSTLAGGGLAGAADGVGTAASFTDPRGIAVDSTGIVYVSEYGSHRIRKISPAGVVSTYAGTGAGGLTNGDTMNASFLNPTGLAVDRLNNLYVADYGNSLIRKITPGGVVSTMAGKANSSVATIDALGTAATFYQPYALTIDAGGSLFVADYGSHRIRKVLTKGYMLDLSPALPAGLSFDASTGTFSGTPTTVTAATAYMIMAYNDYGNSTATFTIAVNTPPTLAASPVKTADNLTIVNPENIIDAEGEMPAPKLNPALSPNHDGVNDVLRIDNIEKYPDNRVTLMDKSGKSVYEVSGYDNTNKAFDGHARGNGVMLAPGTYFYIIEYRSKGELKRKTGYFVMKY
jgi:gliding motility-associated-like protein